jgi:hypothetical protein
MNLKKKFNNNKIRGVWRAGGEWEKESIVVYRSIIVVLAKGYIFWVKYPYIRSTLDT